MSMPKELILETYVVLIKNFFDSVSKSENMKELDFPVSNLCIGIHSIHRVFEYAIMKTKNIERAIYYAQQTYYYYLEYMNQIQQSNLSQRLNHIDAVLFVYKKTIFDLSNNDNNTMTNIMTLNNHSIVIDEDECRALFLKISKIMNVIFHFSNTNITFYNRKIICDVYLERFLWHAQNMDISISYLDIIQQKIELQFEIYEELLKEIIEKYERQRKNTKKIMNKHLTASEQNEHVLMKFYVEEPIFNEKFHEGNMKEFVQWLYT
jgi:adenylate kinase family enzyme